MTEMRVRLRANGVGRTGWAEPRRSLPDFLREDLGLTGTHVGCEHGACGACTVLLDGKPVRSCLMFAVQADGREITTVEGFSPSALLNPLQEAMRDSHAFTATNGVTGQFQVLRSTGGLAHRGELAENVAVLAELFPAVLRGKPKAMAGQLSGGSGRWSRSRSPWPAGPR
jgi:aerobic-type carbon monoxide dehydrogenase small subunit (CoxS/CutS family)